ncbi:growth factor receptor-bound protein 14-like isoform X3 [Chiloscyllium plagiosum]|uniref:growth factor receptor-bound protein 14-like isoform X3 n=1 Tax=Chiloscyllium plagiosum TaxID=36176 RepID=UPI001CB83D85|nr:growth factor receptor-bound protein 14-like isoform X3 [Chiloscyllium plagiosum]
MQCAHAYINCRADQDMQVRLSSSLLVIKVFNEDGTSQTLEVPSDIIARDMCQLFLKNNHCVNDNTWTLIEYLPRLDMERVVEDHESVIQFQSTWGMDTDSRLYFRKNSAKYEFFKSPSYFPEHMVTSCSESNGSLSHSQLIQNFLNSSTYPEVHGYLHAREQGKKTWKKCYFVLRRSGLYFSTKGTSKEPRHLQFMAEFSESNVYTLLSARKMYGAPTNFGFCIKLHKSRGTRDLKLLCAEDEQSKMCWVTVIRLFKSLVLQYGMQLYQNYKIPQQRRESLTSLNSSPMRSASENSLVAMDFSGHKGRVIENPMEALTVATEEGLAWRRRSCHRLNAYGSPTTSQSTTSCQAIHRMQLWFHHRLSRDEAQKLLEQQGLVDGMFLLRDSQSNQKSFVLSLCHCQKIRHFQIVPLEEDGESYYSLDEGHTKFTDLIQLVDFYQLNKGMLPCKLKHHCARITL